MSELTNIAIQELTQAVGNVPVLMPLETLDEIADIVAGKGLVEMYKIVASEKATPLEKTSAFGKVTQWQVYSGRRKEYEASIKDNRIKMPEHLKIGGDDGL